MATVVQAPVFISYAHQDAAEIARRLHTDLSVHGIEAWLDVTRLSGGASWTLEIEHALDSSEVVLALLSRGSYLSDTCRAEQLRSLRKGKCVIPILTQPDADRPIHLESKQYVDFSAAERYPDQLEKLLAEIRKKEGATLNAAFRETYVTVPPLPSNYIERPRELQTLRAQVIADGAARRIALTALKGMAGIGKTVLAQALCFDDVIQAVFPDGIVWLPVGKDPRDLLPLFREAARATNGSLDGYDSLQSASTRLRSHLREKAVLIVLDDVWDARDAAPFLMDSPRSRLLITTRDARTAVSLGARQHQLDVLTWEQSRQLIALWADVSLAQLPAEADEIIRECDSLPLALAMVGAQLRGKPDRWANVLQKLRNADLDRIRQSFPEYPHPDLLRAIDVSLEALTEAQRARYLDFAVFPEDVPIPEAAVRTLWRLDQYDTEDAIDQLVDLSLLTRDEQKRLRVHDLLLDYLRHRLGSERLIERHNTLLQSYAEQAPGHPSLGPHDGYYFENLIWHLRSCGRGQEALQLLLDFRWLNAKLRACGNAALLSDYEWYVTRESDARTVQETLRLAAYVLSADVNQLADQLLARLEDGESAALDALRRQAYEAPGPRLRPRRTLLTGPGGALVFTLAGHSARVRKVALSPDGTRALSASDDHTIRVWDLRRGTLERTLTGHSDFIRAVDVLPDGRRAVSAGDDHTLRVWNLSTGQEEARIDTQADWIRALVAISGVRVAALSDDRMIKIWNLETRTVDTVLSGHTAQVNCLALMPGQGALVSAGDDRTVRIWNLSTNENKGVLKGHRARITALAVTRDQILSLSADGAALLWSGADQPMPDADRWSTAISRKLPWMADGIRDVTFTADGSILGAGDDSNIHFRVATDRKGVLEGHSDWVNTLEVTPDGRYVVSGSDDGTVKVWDLSRVGTTKIERDHGDRVRSVVLTPDEQRVLSTSDDHTLRVWSVPDLATRRVVAEHYYWVFACAPDGKHVVSAGSADSCYVWELHSARVVQEFRGHEDRVRCIAVAPSGKQVVSGADDRTLRVWDIESGVETSCIRLERQWPRALVVTPDSRFALTAVESSKLVLWDLQTGAEIRRFAGHADRVNAIALSPDGTLLASASDDRSVRLWNLNDGTELRVLEGHNAKVNAVALFAGDGLVVSASDDGDLRVWRINTGETIARFTAESPLLTCAAGPLTNTVVAGDRLGLIHFFTLLL